MLLDVSENAKCCGIIQVIHWSTLLAYKLFGKFAGFVQHTGCSKEKWTKRIWWSKLLPERFSQSLWLKVHLKSIYIHLHGFIVSAHRKERFPSKRTKKYVLKNSPRWIHSKKKKTMMTSSSKSFKMCFFTLERSLKCLSFFQVQELHLPPPWRSRCSCSYWESFGGSGDWVNLLMFHQLKMCHSKEGFSLRFH